MTIEEYNSIYSKNSLKVGYTTGTCATAAAKSCLMMIFGEDIQAVRVNLPIDIGLTIPIEKKQIGEDARGKFAVCAVRKYSGDDPDITDGIFIYVKLYYRELSDIYEEGKCNINISGGNGIGKVTRAGLDQKIGEFAINSAPRRMIRLNLLEILSNVNKSADIDVLIYTDEGEEIAKKTFNPKLGIIGGISILGTSGLVMPMSKKALIDTIKIDMQANIGENHSILAVPGNYGMDFIKREYNIEKERAVEFSNYIGETIDIAISLGVRNLLLIGHIGKFVKLAGGIMNTHSNDADARCELIAAHLIKLENTVYDKTFVFDLARKILYANTTQECVSLLKKAGLLEEVMQALAASMYKYANARAKKALELINKRRDAKLWDLNIGIITYTMEEGELARAGMADRILEYIRAKKS